MPIPEHNQLLTLQEAADIVAVSTRTLRRKINAGELAAHKFGRLWRIKEDDLLTFIQEHKQGVDLMSANVLI